MGRIASEFTVIRDPLGRLKSAQQVYVWMDNYCKANPLKTVTEAGYELVVELMEKK